MANALHVGPADDVDMSCTRAGEPFRFHELYPTWKNTVTIGSQCRTVSDEIRYSGGFPEPGEVIVGACRGVPWQPGPMRFAAAVAFVTARNAGAAVLPLAVVTLLFLDSI
ncbi:hypothetical protein [Burkholderia stabilis]|uniref:hypothetical protein n=1 Tax=Burkholderia stabilis TaxID=95485 RepID=UPI001589D861|nr:hypothetical protein [Burkholderia stabilis]